MRIHLVILAVLLSVPAFVHSQDLRFELVLGERRFDPLVRVPHPPEGWSGTMHAGSDLRLLQFIGPTQESWLDSLRADGVEPVQYIAPFAYVVWADASALERASERREVRWSGSFYPAYRVLPKWRSLGDDRVESRVLLYRGADVDGALAEFTELEARVSQRADIGSRFAVVRLSIPGNRLREAARIPGVYSIQPIPTDGGLRGEMSAQLSAGNADSSGGILTGYPEWLDLLGVDGGGVIVACVDSGVDDAHPDLAARFVACSGVTCAGAVSSAHGTHTAGIMAADGSTGVVDAIGHLRGLGYAPGAELIEQLFSPWYTEADGMLLLLGDSAANGALISGNSWGSSGTPQGYDVDAMQVDIGVRDALAGVVGEQSMTYVLSFMNGGGGTSSQGSPDEAKNIFTIGSTELQVAGGGQGVSVDDLSANTAHGPALDGRSIPHLVAPGCWVDSTLPGVGHGLMCGTSMAAPAVSGAVALFVQRYRQRPGYTADPSPALIKAAFLPVAHDLAGSLDADGGVLGHRFDSKQGWGRLNLGAVLDPVGGIAYFDNPTLFDATGDEWQVSVTAIDPSAPLRVMLVWTDAPGPGLGGSTPAWSNDLDLFVDVGPDTFRGNVLGPDGWATTGGASDGKNNTEGVLLGPDAPVVATVRVLATNIGSDGVPGSGDDTDQDFAVVIYNGTVDGTFALSVDPVARVCVSGEVTLELLVESLLGFADPVSLTAPAIPPGITVEFGQNPVLAGGNTTITLAASSMSADGAVPITVRGISAGQVREVTVELTVDSMVPAAPILTAPSVGELGVDLQPLFQWDSVGPDASYEFELGTDSAFTTLVATAQGLTVPIHTVVQPLLPATLYFWRVRSVNGCGVSSAVVGSFATRDPVTVLLVDDDDNSPDVGPLYLEALDLLDLDYSIWDTGNSDDEPDATTLMEYSVVVWFCGDEWGGAAGPGPAGETSLASYLDAGGRLFLSGQDYYYDRGLTGLMTDYLGVASVTGETGHTSVVGEEPPFVGFGPFSLSFPFTNWSDTLAPQPEASVAFVGDAGTAGVAQDAGGFRCLYFAFPWEAITDVERQVVLDQAIAWLVKPGDDCNGNGIGDDQDLANCDGSAWCGDCNANGILDECDLAGGVSLDSDGDGQPDECCVPFLRGDVDQSGAHNIIDAILVLVYLFDFGDEPAPVVEAGDVDGDSIVELDDIIYLLQFIFEAGPPPPPPYPTPACS